LQFQQPDTTS